MAKDKFIKTIWLSIDGNKMMRDTYKGLLHDLEELREKNVIDFSIFEPWQTDAKSIYIKIEVNTNHYAEVLKTMNEWSYYNPVKVLSKKPKAVNE